MKKKLLAIILAASLALGGIPAINSATGTIITAEAAKKKTPAKKKVPSVKKLRDAIAAKYGESYVANVALTKEEIKAKYGILPSWYTSISAEVPMIGTHVDNLVIVKAKNKTTKKKIKNALTKHRQSLINDTMQYPINVLKIQASRVYVKGDFVFFILLGFIDNKTEETDDDEQILKAYKALNQKAVSAINALLK